MAGIKHLIECHCFLAIYKSDKKNPPLHKFPVYSKLDEYGNIISKFAKCNNCDSLHKVTEIGNSEFVPGKDEIATTITKDDISNNIPQKYVNLLNNYGCDISSWEHVEDVINEKRWGETIVLSRDIVNEKTSVKILEIISKDNFKISNEIIDDFLRGN
jgi:hypothetical protein